MVFRLDRRRREIWQVGQVRFAEPAGKSSVPQTDRTRERTHGVMGGFEVEGEAR